MRGGRFVTGFGGEQFALSEAVESLRSWRHRDSQEAVTVAGADPMNLAGIVVPGERVAAVPGRTITYIDGLVAGEEARTELHSLRSQRRRPVVHQPAPTRVSEPTGTLRLF